MKKHIKSIIALLAILGYLVMALSCYEKKEEYPSNCELLPEPKVLSQDLLIRVLDKETKKAVIDAEVVIISKKYSKVVIGMNEICKLVAKDVIINYVFTGQDGIAHFPIEGTYNSKDDYIKLQIEARHPSYILQYQTMLLFYSQSTAGITFNLLKKEIYP